MVKNLFMLVSSHVETMKKRKKNYFSVPSNIAKQEDKLHKNIQQWELPQVKCALNFSTIKRPIFVAVFDPTN